MRKSLIITGLFGLFMFLFVSCTRDGNGDGSDNGANGEHYFTMTVDGATKSAKPITANLRNYTAYIGGVQTNLQHLMISEGGFGNSQEVIVINLTNFKGPQTYAFPVGNEWNHGQYNKSNDVNDIYAIESGILKVTDYDGKTVKGTFEFLARVENTNKTVNITNGKFSLPVAIN